MSTITLVPFGGLANRMRAIASAYYLSNLVGSNLKVIWFVDKGLGAKYSDIFDLPSLPIQICEATKIDYLFNGIPNIRNLWIPFFAQLFRYDARLDESRKRPCSTFSFENWAKGKNVWWSSCHRDIIYPSVLLSELFVPTKRVQLRINEFTSLFHKYTIGVHIRRTDNQASIKYSPDELFIEQLNEQILNNQDVSIFLATDSEHTKDLFIKRFGSRIITSNYHSNRSTVQGIVDGLAEMYSLSRTNNILGSYYSSYSEVAAEIGGTKLLIVKDNNSDE